MPHPFPVIARFFRLAPCLGLLLMAGCAASEGVDAPSLLPRPVEKRSDALPAYTPPPLVADSALDAAIARTNAVEYGLAAYLFTNDLQRAATFAEDIDAAWIGINNFTPSLADAPVGGVKDSGLGYEGGPEGLDAYQQIRFISQSNLRV